MVEFKVDRKAYEKLMSTAISQKGMDAVKINYGGVSNGNLRNISIPPSKLDEFNKAIKIVKRVGN